MVNPANNLQFELSTGSLLADQACVNSVEAGHAPRNLAQLLAMGKLVVNAGNDSWQNGADNGETVSLPEILQNEQYEGIKAPVYGRLDTSEWDMDDFLDYGRWLDSLTKDPQQVKTGLSREVIRRAYHIGIGPSNSRIERKERFGTITGYYHALEVLPNRGLYKYDEWSSQELADYAEGIFQDLRSQAEGQTGHSLRLNDEIERRAHLGLGPALWIFKRNGGGGVMKFMAMNGYADSKNMEPEDYIRLGARFMRANGGQPPTASAIDFLALSLRAPTSHAIWTKFSWTDYLGDAKAAYEEQEELRKQTQTQKLLAIRQELENGSLPHSVIKGAPAMELIARRARWQVLGKLIPNLNPELKQSIAQRADTADFIAAIRCRKFIESADIEQAAKSLDVHDDIWRDDAYMEYLRVPGELLGRGSTQYLAKVRKRPQAD